MWNAGGVLGSAVRRRHRVPRACRPRAGEDPTTTALDGRPRNKHDERSVRIATPMLARAAPVLDRLSPKVLRSRATLFFPTPQTAGTASW